jgi:hypothetical protein
MEIEEHSHLPFMDIDIYRKTDSSLGHKVYQKPPTPISTYTTILITTLLTNNPSSLP